MKKFILSVCLMALYSSFSLSACTGIELIGKDQSIVHGRTLEFGIQVETEAAVVPRGYEFVGSTPSGPGLAYKTKYASVGCFAFNYPALMDGMNEKGLAVGAFYFPGYAGYSTITPENQPYALSPIDFPNWILSQFESIDEVKAALNQVVLAPTIYPDWGTTPIPLHYVVYDKSGKSLAIEPMGGKLLSYPNPFGVYTNSPTFPWHMTNLRNFINLTPFNAQPVKLRGVTLTSFGQGSGMVGLPGDFTPPSRFIRATIYSTTATPPNNAEEGVLQAFHLLNQFDIPVGVSRSVEGKITATDQTLITCVRDPQTLRYYFKTYDNQSIRFVDLTRFDLNARGIRSFSTAGGQKYIDVSSELQTQ